MKTTKNKSFKKALLLVLVFALTLSVCVALVACVKPEPPVTKHKVTFYDGNAVLKTVEVEEGKLAESYVPTKEGYSFVDWFATPSFNHRYDFSTPITEDVSIFAGFTQFSADTREFYIVGSGTSSLLSNQSWGNGITDEHKLAKQENANEYTITLDLMEGDEFQFAINNLWHNKRGYGYLATNSLADGTVVFGGAGGGLGEVTSKGMNIQVKVSGNYTITLKTYPSEDFYKTDDPSYTEAQKEVYNYGKFDQIIWVRNGDPINPPVVVLDYYIKGAGITGWQDMWSPATKMTNTDGVYSLSVYLKQGEEFMFASSNTIGDVISTGTSFIKHANLDDASKELFTGTNNMVAKATGMYSFSYASATEVLSVTFDAETVPEQRDYYLDGTFAGAWGDTLYGTSENRKPGTAGGNSNLFIDDYKLTETAAGSGVYQILGVTLPADTELIIQSYEKGATEPGVWNTDSYKFKGTYNSAYLLPKLAETDNFGAVSATNKNIKVKTAGVYNITFNSYSQVITINDGYDIYIKGDMNSWTHGYSADWKLVQNAENKMLYELEVDFTANQGFGLALYNKGANDPADLGTFINKTKAGDATDTVKFVPEGGTNFKASVTGTYRIVYNAETDKVDFYLVEVA